MEKLVEEFIKGVGRELDRQVEIDPNIDLQPYCKELFMEKGTIEKEEDYIVFTTDPKPEDLIKCESEGKILFVFDTKSKYSKDWFEENGFKLSPFLVVYVVTEHPFDLEKEKAQIVNSLTFKEEWSCKAGFKLGLISTPIRVDK